MEGEKNQHANFSYHLKCYLISENTGHLQINDVLTNVKNNCIQIKLHGQRSVKKTLNLSKIKKKKYRNSQKHSPNVFLNSNI